MQINIEKRHFVIFLSTLILLGTISYAIAVVPNPGHSGDDIEVIIGTNSKTLQEAIDDGSIGGGAGGAEGLWTQTQEGTHIYYTEGDVSVGTSTSSSYKISGSEGNYGVNGVGVSIGVRGYSPNGYGIRAESTSGYALYASSWLGKAIIAESNWEDAIVAESAWGDAIVAKSPRGNAIYATSKYGYAGIFDGAKGVKIDGDLEVTGDIIGGGVVWFENVGMLLKNGATINCYGSKDDRKVWADSKYENGQIYTKVSGRFGGSSDVCSKDWTPGDYASCTFTRVIFGQTTYYKAEAISAGNGVTGNFYQNQFTSDPTRLMSTCNLGWN